MGALFSPWENDLLHGKTFRAEQVMGTDTLWTGQIGWIAQTPVPHWFSS